ncbi:MAG: hypothetical protein J0I07_30900, partial [Myxococcales bacterium]|nr:hypothetical protein [Myxococcales bacterium]
TVPIGADADVNLLSDVARGGGGVVVPYQPGQRLEATAIEVLNATYGTTLRDVEVVLPEGLRDRAPATIAPLRAGGETIVTARMSGDSVKGDIILRGKVGGDPFEAKYPIDVRATTDAGNAFVPRLFAAARIADREREPGDLARPELVALSRRFAVPSRATSLLVLESEAMFKAFGIERAAHGPQWTGEAQAQGSAVATATVPNESSGQLSGSLVGDDEATSGLGALAEAKKEASAASGFDHGGGGPASLSDALTRASGASAAPPAPTMAPPPPAAKVASPGKGRFDAAPADPFDGDRFARRRPGRFMKKIFVRRATVTADASPAVAADKVTQARAAVAAAPDERSKHKELARMLALSGQLDELSETLEKWSSRDPLDVDVIVGRADVAARRGDRDAALRILGGTLAASALTPADAFAVAQAVGRSYDRLGKAEGCAFHVAAAELRGSDPDALARAITCERAQGRAGAAERWLAGLKDAQRTAVSAAITKLEAQRSEGTFGDVVVSATWSGGVDLDVVLVDPSGRRAGAVSRLKNARVDGATSRDRETVALSSGEAGSFLVEMVRTSVTDPSAGTIPVAGTVTVKAFGQTRSIPFTLTGARTQVGRVDVRWESELVPVDDVPIVTPPPVSAASFDRSAAAGALASVNVQHCTVSGQVGTGHVIVTFSPTGRVSDVVVDDANFSGTPAGRCVQTAFFNAVVPPFAGASVRIGKSFTLGTPLAR